MGHLFSLFLLICHPAVFVMFLSVFLLAWCHEQNETAYKPSPETIAEQKILDQIRPADSRAANPLTPAELRRAQCIKNEMMEPKRDCDNRVIPGQINPAFGREYVTKQDGLCAFINLDAQGNYIWRCMEARRKDPDELEAEAEKAKRSEQLALQVKESEAQLERMLAERGAESQRRWDERCRVNALSVPKRECDGTILPNQVNPKTGKLFIIDPNDPTCFLTEKNQSGTEIWECEQ